jgi:uncharacterized protein YpmB
MDKKKVILIGILGILFVLAGIIIAALTLEKSNSEKEYKELGFDFSKDLTPLELSQNKEKYEGKEITVKGAYIPSEAFIYIQQENDRIYLEPANRNYCRNYDLKGTLKYDSLLSRWEFYPENYDNCLDE